MIEPEELSRERVCEVVLMGAFIDLCVAIGKRDERMMEKVMRSVKMMIDIDPKFMPRLNDLRRQANAQMERDLMRKANSPIV